MRASDNGARVLSHPLTFGGWLNPYSAAFELTLGTVRPCLTPPLEYAPAPLARLAPRTHARAGARGGSCDMEDTMRKYIVADNAPPWVAGRRVSPGDVLTLSEIDASYEVARGLLVPAGAATAAKAEADKADAKAKDEKAPKGRRSRKE